MIAMKAEKQKDDLIHLLGFPLFFSSSPLHISEEENTQISGYATTKGLPPV